MPEKRIRDKAMEDLREGKSASTAAGEFVHEEIEHVRQGRHGAANTKQAIAIGLSKARRAGVPLKSPGKGQSAATKKKAAQDSRKGRSGGSKKVSAKRSRAVENALKRQPKNTASKKALSKQAKSAAKKRSAASRSQSAKKASRTKGPAERSAAAKKAARTRAKHR